MAPGRPRLSPADYEERLASYCRRYGVSATVAGIPPFPAGRRETDQHREWLSLYKAHSRLYPPTKAVAPSDGSCAVCGRPVASDGGVAHGTALLHDAHGDVVQEVRSPHPGIVLAINPGPLMPSGDILVHVGLDPREA
jgi:hypothetical protein